MAKFGREEVTRKLRGVVDLVTGCYPSFVFGASLGKILPVFHFHEVTPETLEPQLLYLAENGYRTVTSEAISRFVRLGVHPGSSAVALCFDDAYASLWTVGAPLLRKYGFSAIAYAIPARIENGHALRPTIEEQLRVYDLSQNPFVTWSELKTLYASGLVDVQCHSFSHSTVFCSNRLVGFVTPAYQTQDLLSRPLISADKRLLYLRPPDLGAPIYCHVTRMSDSPRFYDDHVIRDRCTAYVQARGGTEFFARPNWRKELESLVPKSVGFYETSSQHERAIYEELDQGRASLNERLGTNTVRHLCFPWGIAGKVALRAVKKIGYETAFSDRWFGMRAVRAGDNPFQLMRLKNDFIFWLPGRCRRIFIFNYS